MLRSAHTVHLYVFVWIWEQTAIISLYSIKWLVFITETVSVYCEVRTEYLYITSRLLDILRSCHGSSGQSPASHSKVLGSITEQSNWDLWWKSGTGTGVFSNYIRFSLSVTLRQSSTLIFSYALFLPEGQTGEAWNHSKNQCYFVNRGALDR
jgi:hypothetical protein